MKTFVAFALALVVAVSANAQTNYSLDNSHSNVLFTVSHMVVSDVTGSFKSFTGSMSASKADFTDAKVDFSVDVSSVNTDNTDRDNHLKSDDFFNAEKFPKMTFKSKSMKKVGNGKYKLTGDLTIRNVTKTVTFDVKYGGEVKDPWGNTKVGFKAVTTINRLEYDVKFNKLVEAGGAVVGKDVEIKLNLEFKKG